MVHNLYVLFFLYKSKSNEKGTSPIFCRLTLDQKRRQFSTGHFSKEANWNIQTQRYRGTSIDAQHVNTSLEEIRTKLLSAFDELIKERDSITVDDVYNRFSGNDRTYKTLLQAFDYHNQKMKELIGKDYVQATYDKFVVIQNHVQAFLKAAYKVNDCPLSEIKLKFLHDLDHYLKVNKDQNQNTIKQTNDAYTEILSGYDYMGNITSMERKDKDGNDLNNLLYYYDTPSSNVLTKINDNGSENISGTFSYDGNGNMTADSYKGITIHYNYLNLPDTVTKGTSKLILTYDAAGNKLSEQLDSAGTVIRQRHYVEDVELTATATLADAVIESIAMDEGRIVNTDSGFKYEYTLQNHLYSNQVSFRPATDSTLTVSMVQNYYPFGRDMGDTTMNYSLAPNNRYKYENKEWQPGLGMDMYDFGARFYDPTLATWHSIDPLAEESPEWSGYNYVEDNPMNIIDPDGMQSCSQCSAIPFGGGEAALGSAWNIAGTAGGAVAAGLSIPGLVNKFTPGFSSVQNFSGLGGVQGNGIGLNVPNPGPQAILSQFHPNTFDQWKESGFLGKFTYDIADQAYLSIRSVFWSYGGVNHLNGEYASARDKTLAFGYTAASFIPLRGGSLIAEGIAESVAEHGVIEAGEGVASKGLGEIGGRSNEAWSKLFGWGRNPEGALEKLKNVSPKDVERLKGAGASLKDVEAWRAFYKDAINKVATQSNRAAKYRMDLMNKLIELWSK